MHTGVDVRPAGAPPFDYSTPVRAAADGWVEKLVDWGTGSHGLGNTVILSHSNGKYSLYGHLDLKDAGLFLGMFVAQGSQLGIMGNSSTVHRDTFGTHVHFEIKNVGVLGNVSDDGTFWGYTPGHPDLYGYADPNQYVQAIVVEPIGPVALRNPPPGALNVRSSPGTTYFGSTATSVIDQIGEGQEYVAVARSFVGARWWYFIYLYSSNTPVDGSPYPNNGPNGGWVADAAVEDPAATRASVLTDGLRVRAGPGDANLTLGKIYNGAKYVVFGTPSSGSGCTQSWYKLYIPGDKAITFGGAGEGWSCGDFLNVSGGNSTPNIPSSLGQFRSDGFAAIAVGGTTPESTAVFRGAVSDPDAGQQVKLQIELRRLAEGAFTGSFTQESGLVTNGSVAQITVFGLINDTYHWRARTVDSLGAASPWLSFGGNTDAEVDFTVNVVAPTNTPPSPTNTPTKTPTRTPTRTTTFTATTTPTSTMTHTASPTATTTKTSPPSNTPTSTPTRTTSPTLTSTPSPTPAATSPTPSTTPSNCNKGTLALNGSGGGFLDSGNPIDSWCIAPAADGLLHISVQTSGFGAVVRLYDADGSSVLTSANGSLASFDYPLGPGAYFIRISRTFSSDSGSYTISSTFTPATLSNDQEPNDTPATAQVLPVPGSTTGHLGYHSPGITDQYDYFKVTPTVDGLLHVSVVTTGFGASVNLYDADGSSFLTGAGGSLASFDYPLGPGTYFIRIARQLTSAFGSYTISNTFTPATLSNDQEPNDTPATAQALPVPGSTTGHLGYHSPGITDAVDFFKITPTLSGVLHVSVLTSGFGAVVGLYAADGSTFLTGASGSVISFDYPLGPGIFFIRVTRQLSVAFGSYTISATGVSSGGTASGNLIPDGRATGDTLAAGGTNIYNSMVVAGRSYCVEVEVPFNGAGTLAGGGPLPILSVARADGVTSVSSQMTASCEPGVASRLSFTPSAADVSGGPLQFHVSDSASSGYPYRVRLTETTMFCARWSVNSYTALIDLQNTTDCTVAGQVLILNSSGVTLTALPFNLLPDTATQFAVPTGLSALFGSAILTHDGPPGAIAGGIYMAQIGGGTAGANFRWPFLEVRSYGSTDGR